jgi:hypothetical protein
MSPVVDPSAEWRILIKGMGGPTGEVTPWTVQINTATNRYSRTTTGIISDTPMPRLKIQPGGPYLIAPITVPYDPVHGTGGSFWRMIDGPYPGWLLSKWTNTLSDDFGPYGNITVSQAVAYDRGPGDLLATIYRPAAHLAGASLNYNAPGEMHFTMLVDDPLVRVPKPKRTHYAIEFWTGSAWEEVFAGWIWDMDATDTEVVYYGIDYLAAFRYVVDERFDATAPEDPEPEGSFYKGRSTKYICQRLLQYAIDATDSLVGFIDVGDIAGELELAPVFSFYSTFGNILDTVVGLIDSYRAGTGIMTRLKVIKVGQTYKVTIVNNPGQARDDLMLDYTPGGLVQGYHVIPFGESWASRVNVVSRNKFGIKVNYETVVGAAIQSEWGRVTMGVNYIDTEDLEDLKRRGAQMAVDASAMGKQISVGLRTGSYRPLEEFDLCDWVPVNIVHGGVNTQDWDSHVWGAEGEVPDQVWTGYWMITGVTWESFDDGHWVTGLSLFPKNGIPYTPAMAEPDYHNHLTRGGDNWICYEIVGAEYTPQTAKDTGDMTYAGGGAVIFPSVSGIDTAKEVLIITAAGINQRGTPLAPTSGWTKDCQLEGADGGMMLHAQHRFYSAGTAGPIAPALASSASWGGAIVAYQPRAGQTLAIRQIFTRSGGVAWPGPTGFDFPLAPLLGSTLVAFGNNGEWFIPGSWDPAHALTNGFNPYVGDGIINVRQGGYFGNFGQYIQFQWMKRIPYYEEGIVPVQPPNYLPVMETGIGPPPATTDPSSVQYTDTATGIVYDYINGVWVPQPGTGYAASGLYDFTFAASTQWVINHTLGSYPRVTLRDTTGAVIVAAIVYNSTTQITISFSSAVAGSAHLG